MPKTPTLSEGQVVRVESELCAVAWPLPSNAYQVVYRPGRPVHNSIHWNGEAWVFSRRLPAPVRDGERYQLALRQLETAAQDEAGSGGAVGGLGKRSG